MRLRRLVLAVCLITASAAGDKVLIESPRDNRVYLIDLESKQVQSRLQPAHLAAPGPIPAWLAPHPGAVPEKAEDTGYSRSANYRVTGSIEQLYSYYDQLIRSRGYGTKSSQTGANYASVSATNDRESISVRLTESRGEVRIYIRVSSRGSSQRVSGRQLEDVWYDDARGVLLVQDQQTGEQFLLNRASFPTVAESYRALAAAPRPEGQFPAWLPLYPGAAITRAVGPPDKVSPNRRPTVIARQKTADSVEKVVAFYESYLTRSGVEIFARSTRMNSKSTEMIRGELGGRTVIGDQADLVFVRFLDETNISIRYLPPKQHSR